MNEEYEKEKETELDQLRDTLKRLGEAIMKLLKTIAERFTEFVEAVTDFITLPKPTQKETNKFMAGLNCLDGKMPERISDFAYVRSDPEKKVAWFYATPKLVKLMKCFGEVVDTDIRDRYAIYVDHRYDLTHVTNYCIYLSTLPPEEEDVKQGEFTL